MYERGEVTVTDPVYELHDSTSTLHPTFDITVQRDAAASPRFTLRSVPVTQFYSFQADDIALERHFCAFAGPLLNVALKLDPFMDPGEVGYQFAGGKKFTKQHRPVSARS
ncbi:hypothetical protein ElyMa_002436700 [Elysia marginata]|uniref:Uncharacterized protein n=1 Tax=Elysia marginata TaxID=1093978 RepID=A0AAV4GJL9_9GAST|nr:hypothetical protein ElyMa_002436700 [Elysia marginata]